MEFPEAAPLRVPVYLDALSEAESLAEAAYDATVSRAKFECSLAWKTPLVCQTLGRN